MQQFFFTKAVSKNHMRHSARKRSTSRKRRRSKRRSRQRVYRSLNSSYEVSVYLLCTEYTLLQLDVI